jgi:hypothetical protein
VGVAAAALSVGFAGEKQDRTSDMSIPVTDRVRATVPP